MVIGKQVAKILIHEVAQFYRRLYCCMVGARTCIGKGTPLVTARVDWWVQRPNVSGFSKIQLGVYYQCCVLIGLATTRLYVIAH